MAKKALIFGISGQDGSYLARFLLQKNYEVYGASRDAQVASFSNLVKLGIRNQVILESVSPIDFRSVLQALMKIEPDEIYNLAGQTSVGLSFQQPVETLESIAQGTLNLLEAIRFTGHPIRLYNAGSGECFGETGETPADETTPFRPRSPYAVAKATAFWEVANYREAYGLYACSGILFNHDSPLRPERFVTKKVIATACRIANGSQEKLTLGNIGVYRDWGWAPEYVEAMWMMLQQESPQDFVIATGETHALQEFVETAFALLDLDWQHHILSDQNLFRPSDIEFSRANPARARDVLGWQARFKMRDVVRGMVEAELNDSRRLDAVRANP
jgi:GDPmannose 4,6-dehydratase